MQRAMPTGNTVASDSDATGDNGMGGGGGVTGGEARHALDGPACDVGARLVSGAIFFLSWIG